MQYVLMIHAAESRFASRTPAQKEEIMNAYMSFTRSIVGTGRSGDRAALQPTATATTVKLRGGKRIVKDGPFPETREQLGGYYSIEAAEDEALDWAAKVPDAQGGTVEVRALRPGAPPPATERKAGPEYLLLIYEAEGTWDKLAPAEREKTMSRYRDFSKSLVESGKYVAGSALESAATAKSLTLDGSKRIVRDGPFAETREQLGGYYRIHARDLDEAIALATKIPACETGTIEVRPLVDMSRYDLR